MNADDRLTQIESMMVGDTHPLDLVTIRATVDRALQVRRSSIPPHKEIFELASTLRGHLAVMVDEVEARRDALTSRTYDWHQWNTLSDRARTDLKRSAGDGLVSALEHMQEIARTCEHIVNLLSE
ncbi:DUF6415 family natural product biosynthesis protein [Streptomyces sp. NPDC052396]|uniref:DUF6415 family natural product biosynthesis protein n=1 Tax=Streptomyces sp. NPDC052396 TaxID=3365689 RepID=UPI0037D872C7